MGDTTGIGWTDSTFNPWWGCTRISPGCDNCYAATFDHRLGQNYWDPKITPRMMSAQNWNRPLRWNREAEAAGKRHKVFSGSMCDVFDNKAPEGQRERLWALIRATPWLDWQLLTKRATLIERSLPADWGDGYPNVWLGVSVEDNEHGVPRVAELQKIPARIRFLSIEPLIELLKPFDVSGIHWAIIGGESGPGHRAMRHDYAVRALHICRLGGLDVFFKQWGGDKPDSNGCLYQGHEIKEFPVAA